MNWATPFPERCDRSPHRNLSHPCLVVPAPELEPFLLANPHVLLRMLRTEVRRLRAAELVNE